MCPLIIEPGGEEGTWIEWTRKDGYVVYERRHPRTDQEWTDWMDTQPIDWQLRWACALIMPILAVLFVLIGLLLV